MIAAAMKSIENRKNQGPLVSIGVPVYNGERFIRTVLDSLLAQSYTNLEIVISDNASTDGTAAICRDYAARDRRIRYSRSSVTVDVDANYWRAFQLSSGEYFTWTAADDVRPRYAIEECLRALLANESAVMAHGGILIKAEARELELVANDICLSETTARKRIAAFTRELQHNAMLYGLYRRSALARCTWRRRLGNDYLLCLQICLLGAVEHIHKPMITYDQRRLRANYIHTPMYQERRITLYDVLRGRRPRKCLLVLLFGSYYLLKLPGVRLSERLGGVTAHIFAFLVRYRSRLAKEVLFKLCAPVSWVSRVCWDLAGRWRLSHIVSRKLRDTKARA